MVTGDIGSYRDDAFAGTTQFVHGRLVVAIDIPGTVETAERRGIGIGPQMYRSRIRRDKIESSIITRCIGIIG